MDIWKTKFRNNLWLYLVSYVIIIVIGNMMARTTTVGLVLSVIYLIVEPSVNKTDFLPSARKAWFGIGFMILLLVPYFVNKYNTDVSLQKDMRFAFEGFFSLIEKGKWDVGSNTQLKNMIVFPDNFKTWIIGDGYFDNPIHTDPYYVGEITGGYYKGTDIGYLRFIFYMGLAGLFAFSVFMCKAAQMAMERFREYRMMMLFLLVVHFVVWFKVSSDCFVIFALLLCIPKEDNDKYNKLIALNNENSL